MNPPIRWSPVQDDGGTLVSLDAHEWFQIITSCKGIVLLVRWKDRIGAWELVAQCDTIIEAQTVAEVENHYLGMGIR